MMAKNKPLRSNNKFIHKLTDKGGGGGGVWIKIKINLFLEKYKFSDQSIPDF